jgi:hypothetical protein
MKIFCKIIIKVYYFFKKKLCNIYEFIYYYINFYRKIKQKYNVILNMIVKI